MSGAAAPFHVIVPARYGSSRFPGKPLADLRGRPMVVRVAERAAASGAASVTVATDDERILRACEAHGHRAIMTSAGHACGTDRVAEAARSLGLAPDALVVNLQGDEPLVPPALVREVAAVLASNPEAAMATACHRLAGEAEAANPSVVKVVLDARGFALYFSRARIPYPRSPDAVGYRHAGIYAMRAAFLAEFTRLEPSPLERAESLEQLRALWHGRRIAVAIWPEPVPPGVDTPEDLEAVRRMPA